VNRSRLLKVSTVEVGTMVDKDPRNVKVSTRRRNVQGSRHVVLQKHTYNKSRSERLEYRHNLDQPGWINEGMQGAFSKGRLHQRSLSHDLAEYQFN